MLDVVFSTPFKKDLKLAKKRGYNLDLLDEVVVKLQNRETLPPKNCDHDLTGDYIGFRECHILPDWLLVYRVDEEELFLSVSHRNTFRLVFTLSTRGLPIGLTQPVF